MSSSVAGATPDPEGIGTTADRAADRAERGANRAAHASSPASSHADRLDHLPYTREHHRLLVGSGIGWALDAMDVGLIGYVMAALKVHWELADTTVGAIGSIGFVGMALGATFGGLLADRFGRRQVFAATLLVYGLATGAAAFSVGVAMLMVLRFVVGLGLGAELPVASTLVSEYAPSRMRGRLVVLLEAFWAIGWFMAALIGFLVVGPYEQGWRWALALGAVPAVYALWVRHKLPESARFLLSQHRVEEAEAAVRRFETSPRMFGTETRPGLPGGPPDEEAAEALVTAQGPQAVEPVPADLRPGPAGLFHPQFRRRTFGLWGVWFLLNFAYYGAFTWMPSLLVAEGLTLTRSFGYTVIITAAQLPGYALAAWLIEAWGRKPTLGVFLTGSAIGALLFALAETPVTVVLAGCALSFFCLGAWGALYAVSPETYPTLVRATGSGWAAGVGRLASMAAPMAVPALIAVGGTGATFAVFAAAFLLAAASSLLLIEPRGLKLDG